MAATAAVARPRARGLDHCLRRTRGRRNRLGGAAAGVAGGGGGGGGGGGSAAAGSAGAVDASGAAIGGALDDASSVNSAGVRWGEVKALPLNEQVSQEGFRSGQFVFSLPLFSVCRGLSFSVRSFNRRLFFVYFFYMGVLFSCDVLAGRLSFAQEKSCCWPLGLL